MERDDETVDRVLEFYDFNSHAHVERDINIFDIFSFFHISTHTLTWSVTYNYGEMEYISKNFNSHAHVERDAKSGSISIKTADFNSHAHVERDEIVRNWINAQSISTHTLTWSVT